jgi:ClpP class serine protease
MVTSQIKIEIDAEGLQRQVEEVIASCLPAGKASAFDLVAATPWAITPGMLQTISSIARRDNESPDAVESRLGRPLQNTRTVSMRGNVAIVPVTGPVFRYANLFTEISGATSLQVLAREFTAANDDPKVSSIILNIDSPGGQAPGIAEFAHLIRSSTKPVIAYVDGMAASAAYWLASAADEIVVSKTSEVGSIGAVYEIDTSKKSAGVVQIVSSQSPKKRPDVMTDEGRSQIQTRIDNFAQIFIEDVAAYRGVTPDVVMEKFGQGDMRMGAEAVSLGMADRVSTLEEVIAGLTGSSTTIGVKAMNLDELRAAHPDLCAALVAEGHAAGLAAGAAAELQRIKDVEAQTLAGHEALIETLKYDGKTTGAEAAIQVLAAEKELQDKAAETIAADAPKPAAFAAAPSEEEAAAAAAAAEAMTPREKAKAEFDADKALQREFTTFERYAAYLKV